MLAQSSPTGMNVLEVNREALDLVAQSPKIVIPGRAEIDDVSDDNSWDWRLGCPIFLLGLPVDPDCVFHETKLWVCYNYEDLSSFIWR